MIHTTEHRSTVQKAASFEPILRGFFVLALLFLPAGSGNAQDSTGRPMPSVASASLVEGVYGGILPARKIEISTTQEGVIDRVAVQPGEVVRQGQVVVEMDSRKLLIRERLAEQEFLKAKSVVEDSSSITSAKAQFARSEATYNTLVKLDHKVPLEIFRLQMEMREKHAALEFAKTKHAQDLIDVAIKTQQLDAARFDVESCQVGSPISGVVSEQIKHAGEYVRVGEKVLTVVQMDELIFRIEFLSEQLPPHRLADYRVDATFRVAGGALEIAGLQLDRLVPDNMDSRYYYAFATIENQQMVDRNGRPHWQLRPGMSANVELVPLAFADKPSTPNSMTSTQPILKPVRLPVP